MKYLTVLASFVLCVSALGLSGCNQGNDSSIEDTSKVPQFILDMGNAIYFDGDKSRKSVFIANTDKEYDNVFNTFSKFRVKPADGREIRRDVGFDLYSSQAVIIALGTRNISETIKLESVTENGTRNLVKVTYNLLGANTKASGEQHNPVLHLVIHNKKPTVVEETTVLKKSTVVEETTQDTR